MVTTTQDKDLEFLVKLNNQLTFPDKVRRDWPPGTSTIIDFRNYSDTTAKAGDIRKALRIAQIYEFPIEPANTACGFQVGYFILRPRYNLPAIQAEMDILVQFVERQLPKNLPWQELWRTVTSRRNRELLIHYGRGEVKAHSSYEY